MLIIPIENKPEWSKPPFITIGLIVINILVFLLYQGNDNELTERAATVYQQHNLLELEREHFLTYQKTRDPDFSKELEGISNKKEQEFFLFQYILYERGFDIYLREVWSGTTAMSYDAVQSWKLHRQEFEQLRNRISSFEAGMTPAEAKPLTFITSQFLHGGWDHLFGNMVFLFLFGFTLESVLRAHVYLLMYLVSGVAANVLHLALNLDSFIPCVGASGAISGLMGMYLALYRLRRIRFFYNFLFYFGEFRAPALFILPLWLAKELYGHFFVDSNTAYWAHIGGLLAGATMMMFARKTQQDFSHTEKIKVQENVLEQTLKKMQLAMSELNFSKARILAKQACELQPTDPRAWSALFDLAKSQPQNKQFHEIVFAILKQFAAKETPYASWGTRIEDILAQYQKIHPKAPAITNNLLLALAHKFWQNGKTDIAERFLQQAQQRGVNTPTMIKLLTNMASDYQRRQQLEKAAKIHVMLKKLSSAPQ